DYVPKPVRLDDLRSALDRWLPPPGEASPDEAPEQAAGPQRSQDPAVDPAQLQSLRALQEEGEPDVLRELIEMFIGDVQRSLASLRDAAARQDAQLLARAAHTLKGSSANMGAKPLSALSLKIEEAARAGSLSGMSALVQELESEMSRVRSAF